MHSAAFLGRIETVKLLLENGADTTLRSNDGTIPTDVAGLDWQLTQFVVGLLQMEVDETEVKAGRTEVIQEIPTPLTMTQEEFLENDLEGYEYIKGELVPMAAASIVHGEIGVNVIRTYAIMFEIDIQKH